MTAATAVAMIVALASCSVLPTAPISQVSDVTPSPVATPAGGQTASKALSGSNLIDGAVGGVVSAGRWKLQIPAGAFVGSGTVSISVPDSTVAKCDLNINPTSLASGKAGWKPR